MTRRIVPFFVTVMMLIVVSCGSHDTHPDPEKENSVPPDFVAKVETLGDPNHYRVALTWAEDGNAIAWIVSRAEGKNSSPLQLVTLDKNERTYTDDRVSAGRTYRYLLTEVKPSEYREIKEITVHLPRDLEITGEVDMKDLDLKSINRLFLRHGSTMFTNGDNLTFELNEIISDDGLIMSFKEGQTASAGANGRAGGDITIKAKAGQGVLHVIARGENGGTGANGLPGGPGARGTQGINGECGGDGIDCHQFNRGQLDEIRRMATQPGFFSEIYRNLLRKLSCRVQTGDGGQGAPGMQGSPGGAGGAGGKSGKIHFVIEDPSRIQIQPEVFPGSGGVGGQGGSGGPGGAGGVPGQPDSLGLCRNANPGPQGAPGPRGPIGNAGLTGQAEAYCLHLGNATFGTCSP